MSIGFSALLLVALIAAIAFLVLGVSAIPLILGFLLLVVPLVLLRA